MQRLLAILGAVLVLAGTAGTASGGRGVGVGHGTPPPPPFPTILGVWSHDERNVKIKGDWHTMILDHGRVMRATAAQLTLREPDGSIVAVPLAATTKITPPRLAAFPPALRRGLWAITMRIDGGAAVRVRLMLRP